MGAIIRAVQSLPLLLLIALIAAVVYAVVSARKSPLRAKEVTCKAVLVVSAAFAVFFGLATTYAALEHNSAAAEFFAAFLGIAAIAVVVALICLWRFKVNHPHYSYKRQHAHTISDTEKKARSLLSLWKLLKRGPHDPRV